MPPLIRRPGGLTATQLGLVISVGVIGGLYIWKPYVAYFKERANSLKEEADAKKAQKINKE